MRPNEQRTIIRAFNGVEWTRFGYQIGKSIERFKAKYPDTKTVKVAIWEREDCVDIELYDTHDKMIIVSWRAE
jgi:hypothetical protein